MVDFSTIAAIRFGTGLSANLRAPSDADEVLSRLAGPDIAAERFAVTSSEDRLRTASEFIELKKARKQKEDGANQAFKTHRKMIRDTVRADRVAALARASFTEDGFRERLTLFWADHFTVVAKRSFLNGMVSSYVSDFIRPHVTGRFADLLKAAVTSPMMIYYFDQASSFGPNSELGKRKNRGLNENLAREVIELHTLGVNGTYTQEDVRQLAELFTGMTASLKRGFMYRWKQAEPGAETVLGQDYGGMKPRVSDIHEVLEDLAVHPDTARHIARKLAVHFVSDDPGDGLVSDIEQAFLDSGGDLTACYTAMLEHFDAWDSFGAKVRQPYEFVVATIRALGMVPQDLLAMKQKDVRNIILGPMAAMGQNWEEPKGPDGWSEAAHAWINPQGMAGRIQWAMVAPRMLTPRLVDPRVFVETALGDTASDATRFAAAAAESRWEGVGLVLASPEFNRR